MKLRRIIFTKLCQIYTVGMLQNFLKKRYCLDYYEASSLDQIKMTKNWLEFDWNNFTTTSVNIGTWPKLLNDEHYRVSMTEIWMNLTESWQQNIFGHIHPFIFVVVVIFIIFSIFGHIHPFMFIVVVKCIKFSIFGHIHPFMFVIVVIFILFRVKFEG